MQPGGAGVASADPVDQQNKLAQPRQQATTSSKTTKLETNKGKSQKKQEQNSTRSRVPPPARKKSPPRGTTTTTLASKAPSGQAMAQQSTVDTAKPPPTHKTPPPLPPPSEPQRPVVKIRPTKGQRKTAVCGCFGTKHEPLTNCLFCGRISCVVEGYDFCPFCSFLLEEVKLDGR